MELAALLALGLLIPLVGGVGGDDGDDGAPSAPPDEDDPSDITEPAPSPDRATEAATQVPRGENGDDPADLDTPASEEDPAPRDTPDPDDRTDTETLAQGEGAAPLTAYRSGPEGGYNIDIAFDGDWSREQQQAVLDAAEYLSAVVLADQPDFDGVDDLAIVARMAPIDGPGAVAGLAGPELLRPDTLVPLRGTMTIDTDDADPDDPFYDDLVLHEMMHVLGFGTLWTPMGLVSLDEAEQPRFDGVLALDAYAVSHPATHAADPGAAAGIPLSPDLFHWQEAAFGKALMTPVLNRGEDAEIDTMTLAALEDMGYDTVVDDPRRLDDRSGAPPRFGLA